MEMKEYLEELGKIYNEKMENENQIKQLIKKRKFFDDSILEITKNFMDSNEQFTEKEQKNG